MTFSNRTHSQDLLFDADFEFFPQKIVRKERQMCLLLTVTDAGTEDRTHLCGPVEMDQL